MVDQEYLYDAFFSYGRSDGSNIASWLKGARDCFAASATNGKTRVVDVATGTRVAEMIQERPVRGIAFHPASQLVAAMGWDGTVETPQAPDWRRALGNRRDRPPDPTTLHALVSSFGGAKSKSAR